MQPLLQIHETAPVDAQQARRVYAALAGLTPIQLQWVSGYAAGLAASVSDTALTETNETLTVLFGSQTGNGQRIAEALAARARDAGYAVRLQNFVDFKPSGLKRESLVAIVVSTHGEGDPPDDAELVYEYLLSATAPRLSKLRYSVLALGDSSYVNFCQTGRDFDQRLESLGATRVLPIVECDLDFEGPAERWTGDILDKLPELLGTGAAVPSLRVVDSTVTYGRQHPFAAKVLLNQKITASASSKDVRHIELSLEGSGMRYEPGDALAVMFENPPQLVHQIIDVLGFHGDARVKLADESVALEEALLSRLEITAPSLGFVEYWAAQCGNPNLAAMLAPENREALSELLESHQIIDIVRRYPASATPQAFVDSLRSLSPRSYSISSSPSANPDEVHLTVAAVRYTSFGSEHWGAASTALADRISEGDTVSIFVEPNTRFRLPAEDSAPVVMIGPGTGVAPFRAFVEERAEREAAGESWLFFGDRNFSSDFLYQLEWQRHLAAGRLTRMDVAFSRDQHSKLYVQHRIRERGEALVEWIERGAYLYVCGDAKKMAGEVHEALIDVLEAHTQLSRAGAEARLKELRRAGRYQRDVY